MCRRARTAARGSWERLVWGSARGRHSHPAPPLGTLAGPLCQDDDDDEPPPIIIIGDDDIEQEVENVGGVIFVSISITIVNTGGAGRGCFLVFSLDDLDELFDLADVSFLEGVGFVQRIEGGMVYIGLGQNNVIEAKGKLKVKIKFKSKQNRLDIRVNARFSLNIGDTVVEVPPVVIVVPLPSSKSCDCSL